MAYTQFGYPCPTVPTSLPSSQLLMSTSASPQTSSSSSSSCCESGRPITVDPSTGQTVCSCQYPSMSSPTSAASAPLLPYPRVAGLGDAVYSSYAAQGYVPFGADPSAFYSLNGAYDMKDNSDSWRGLVHPTPCYPYDPTMGAGYPYGQSALAQRKNATREATSTLKAWLQEHIKNPYPTKGEKIMLAIITKMTLTQVSTWFANARRRLKKENKMTWSPRNRTDEDGNKLDSDDEDDGKDDDKDRDDMHLKCKEDDDIIDAGGRDSVPLNICVDDGVSDILSDTGGPRSSSAKLLDDERYSSCGLRGSVMPHSQALSQSPLGFPGTTSPNNGSCMNTLNSTPPGCHMNSSSGGSCMNSPGDVTHSSGAKPRIWSLADVATSSNPPESSARGPPPINPKLSGLEMTGGYSPVNSFRPWVNGLNAYANPPQMAPTNTNNGSPSQGAPGVSTNPGLLRSYGLAPHRPEVH